MDDADLFFILNFNEYFWRTKSKVAVRRSGNKRLRVTLILLLSIAPWKFGQVSPKQPVSQFRCQLPQLPSNFYRPQNSSKFWAGLLAAVTTPHQLAGCIYTVIWWQQDYTADTPWAVLERNDITRPSSSLIGFITANMGNDQDTTQSSNHLVHCKEWDSKAQVYFWRESVCILIRANWNLVAPPGRLRKKQVWRLDSQPLHQGLKELREQLCAVYSKAGW